MARKTYTCLLCDHTETRATDLSLHTIKVHGIAYRETYQPTAIPRDVTCWSCVQPIKASLSHCTNCGEPTPDYHTPHLKSSVRHATTRVISTTTEGKI
jgi:hypothetical protein